MQAPDLYLMFIKPVNRLNIPYMVTGVLAKDYVYVQEVSNKDVNQETFYDYNIDLFSDDIHTIGSDWKMYYFKGWEVSDTTVYFVLELLPGKDDNSVWKLYFTNFSGMGDGIYTFVQEELAASVNDVNKAFSTIYPNPAGNFVNLIYDIDGECELSIYNISGQIVYNETINNNEHLNKHQINVANLPAGFYNLILRTGKISSSAKFIKK